MLGDIGILLVLDLLQCQMLLNRFGKDISEQTDCVIPIADYIFEYFIMWIMNFRHTQLLNRFEDRSKDNILQARFPKKNIKF